jgi:two-component sensor histidine kinase
MLLREVHHRVKNNLQVISSLVALQESSFRDEADRTLGKDMQARVGSMARLHELLYGSKDLSGIDTAEYLEAIAEEISTYYGKALVRVEAQSDVLSIDEAMPFGLIATELLTNALKYAYPSGSAGEILVSYGRFGPERRLEIRDEGVGLPPEIDPAKSPSLGFTLVRSLAEQIGGRLSIDAAKPGEAFSGLRVFLAFPVRARDAAP